MRIENQNCKCECSKIVAEMYRDRLNSRNELSPKLDSHLPRELPFSALGSVAGTTKPYEDLKKSTRKCSVVDDDQVKVTKPKTLSRVDSQHRATTKRRQSSGLSSGVPSTDYNKSVRVSDDPNIKLSQQTRELKYKRKKSGLKRKQVVEYSKGLYPGVVTGHVNCVDSPMFVPKNMGWLWNITDEVTGRKPHPDWIPGAVPKYLHRMIKHMALELDGEQIENPLSTAPSKKKLAKHKTVPSDRQKRSLEEFDAQPTLHLHTKKGVYCIRVLTNENDEYRKEPIVFQIGQDDDQRVSSSESSLEIELIRPDMNMKHDESQTNLQESMDEQESPEEIEVPKSKKKKSGPKRNHVK